MGTRPFSRRRHAWTLLCLSWAAVLASGCPRVLYLDYHPSTNIHGAGTAKVETFSYAGHPTGLMKQKELQSGGKKDPEALYLSQDIGQFFTNALKAELTHAGYVLEPASGRAISGTIEQFLLDYVGEQDQRFQIKVSFAVTGEGAQVYESTCRSDRQQTKDWIRSGALIEGGVKACIEEFLSRAQAAGVL